MVRRKRKELYKRTVTIAYTSQLLSLAVSSKLMYLSTWKICALYKEQVAANKILEESVGT